MMSSKNISIHPTALVATSKIGEGTRIWAFVNILEGAIIGENCNICDHCFIENEVSIGNNVTLKCGIYLWDGVTIEDDVFVGPNVVFTNDVRPRSKQYKKPEHTNISKGASLGANSTILAGVTIGKYAMTGIASVVTRNVPDHALVFGNPAKFQGWVDEQGEKLVQEKEGLWKNSGNKYYEEKDGVLKPKS
jgi:acetyltransferase-like isoleucine patch superfamily enzyme